MNVGGSSHTGGRPSSANGGQGWVESASTASQGATQQQTGANQHKRLAVVAVGGNALIRDGQRGTIDEQMENALTTARQITAMVERGWRVVVTHGNGPQVGFILLRSELVRRDMFTPRLSLDMAGADSQGGIGYILANALQRAVAERGQTQTVVSVVTRTVVDLQDPAFQHPTKPIGSFLSQEDAERHRMEEGWTIVEDAGRGYRRVVPSPEPRRIVELDAIHTLSQAGFLVIAAGGGGVPVVEEAQGVYRGIEAVIDKDRASSLLAAALRADLLLVSTGVPRVSINFRRPDQRELAHLTAAEARQYLAEGQFPAGSMGPKIEAAIHFVEAGGPEVLITSPEVLGDALEGRTGTRIAREALPRV